MKQELILAATLKTQEKPTFLIDNLVPRNSLSILYGKPKSGKSFLALKWACELACRETPVLYIAGEGLGGYGARLRAWELVNEPIHAHVPLLFTQRNINLNIGDSVTRLIQLIKSHELMQDMFIDEDVGDLIETTKPVGLVVIDTFSRALAGGDENEAAAVSAAIEQMDRLRNETGAAVLVVHHTTKDSSDDENARERGSSALRGAADVMIHLSARKKLLTVSAARDFESGATWGIELVKTLDSAVINVKPNKAGEQSELGTAQQAVFDALLIGARTITGISELTGMSPAHVAGTLNRLIDKELVDKVSRGLYAPIGQGVDIPKQISDTPSEPQPEA